MSQLFCCPKCNQEIILRKIYPNEITFLEYKCFCTKDYIKITSNDLITEFSSSIEFDNPETLKFNSCYKHNLDYIAYCNLCDIPICPLCENEHLKHNVELIVDFPNEENLIHEFKEIINKEYDDCEEINKKYYNDNSINEYSKNVMKKKFDRISSINSTLFFIIKHYFDFNDKFKPNISLNNTKTIKYLYYNHKEIGNYFLTLKTIEYEKEEDKTIRKTVLKIPLLQKFESNQNQIDKAIFLSNGQYLITSNKTIQILSNIFEVLSNYKNSSNILDIIELDDYNILLSSSEGNLRLIKINNNKVTVINQYDNIKANNIFQLFDENIITYEEEIGCINLRNINHLKQPLSNYNFENPDKIKNTCHFLEIFKKNLLFVALDKEILIFDIKDYKLNLVKKIERGENFGESNLHLINDNKIVIGNNNGSVMYINIENFETEIKKYIENDSESNIIFIYSFNTNNLLYITSIGHIFHINLENNKLISKKKYNIPTKISNFMIKQGKILCIYNNKILKLLKI